MLKWSQLQSIKPNVCIVLIDLKDVFFLVPIPEEHQKYLKFMLNGLFQFTCIPNRYGPAMQLFTVRCHSHI